MKSFAKIAAIAAVFMFMGTAMAEGDTSAAGSTTTDTTETGMDTGTTGTTDSMQDPQETETSRTPTATEQRHPRAEMDEIKTGETPSQASADQSKVRDVQSALSSRGYDVTVDGVMGSNTTEALKRFQRDEGIEETGQLDQATLQALNIEAASDRAPASVPATEDIPTDSGMETDTDTEMETETDSDTGM